VSYVSTQIWFVFLSITPCGVTILNQRTTHCALPRGSRLSLARACRHKSALSPSRLRGRRVSPPPPHTQRSPAHTAVASRPLRLGLGLRLAARGSVCVYSIVGHDQGRGYPDLPGAPLCVYIICIRIYAQRTFVFPARPRSLEILYYTGCLSCLSASSQLGPRRVPFDFGGTHGCYCPIPRSPGFSACG
jgi:hypothetical protein